MFRPPALRSSSRSLPSRSILGLLLVLLTLALGVPAVGHAAPPAQAAPPQIGAKAAIVVEYPSGRILYAKNAHQRLPEASTTKTMTALLVLQRIAVTDVVTATADDLVGESSMGLVEGETQTVHDLLYGLLLPSGNDAAMALARTVGSGLKDPPDAGPVDRFVALMNRQAQQMGLQDSHFMNPHGLDDPNHYSSAYDLASITWYDLHNPTFNEVVSQVFHTVPGHGLRNTNEMLTRYPGADGVKTGMTDAAGNCLITSATRDGRRLIAVVLGEVFGHTYPDTTAILDYGFSQQPDDSTDTLTVARRAELLWYLSAAIPTPLPTPRPTATPTPSPVPSGGLNLAGFLAPIVAPAAGPATAGGGPPAPAGNAPAWLWSLLAVPAGGLLLWAYLQWAPGRRRAAPAPARSSPAVPLPPRRVSLLDGDDLATRAQRAIALAHRGQEGSSLAEFLAIVQRNPEFEFGAVPGFYDMPAAGYLALARAYGETDRRRYASALLQLGQETYPDDGAIRRLRAELDAAPTGAAPPLPG
ncbi:MAG TPA: D-alanyl-D-alanine carboxypeptidase family protein [Chloroflexia bacterium]|nr:D-alanyl-D-alanine carboxypeptidase family protein [Chloroflexia bacterium]